MPVKKMHARSTKMGITYSLPWVSIFGFSPIPIIALVISVIFFLTSLQERCWYRRYLTPLMLILFGIFLNNPIETGMMVVSGIILFAGYKGRGRAEFGKTF